MAFGSSDPVLVRSAPIGIGELQARVWFPVEPRQIERASVPSLIAARPRALVNKTGRRRTPTVGIEFRNTI
jgi:hypothetical protein